MELLHVVHRLGLVAVEAEDLRCDEDVAAAGLDGVGQDELALPGRLEQVVPGRRLLAADVRVEPTRVRDEAEDPRVPAGPEAGGLLELRRHVLRERRLIGLEEALLAQRIVELARAADEDVRLRVVLLGCDLRLEISGGRERQRAHVDAGRLRERREELVVRGLVERRVDRDAARRLRRARSAGRWRGAGSSACRDDGGRSGEH